MNISLSNMMATGVWTAFISVLAIIGIIVAGGFIVALIGKMMLNLVNTKPVEETNTSVDEFGYVNTNNNQNTYMMQSEEMLQHNTNMANKAETMPEEQDFRPLSLPDGTGRDPQSSESAW